MKKLLLFLLLIPSLVFAGGNLKQNTVTTINIGPFHTIATGAIHTGITITNISVTLIKESNTQSSTKTTFSCTNDNGANGCIEVGAGMYNVNLTAANLDTLGRLDAIGVVSGDYAAPDSFQVRGADWWKCHHDGDCASILDIPAIPTSDPAFSTAGSWGKAVMDIPALTWDTLVPEPTIPLSDSNSAAAIAGWLKIVTYNQITQTNTTKTLHNDAGTAVATQTVSDDGATYTQTKAATP